VQKKAFGGAAAYNLRILNSMLHTGSVDKDIEAIAQLYEAGGIQVRTYLSLLVHHLSLLTEVDREV
jgi:hypothetical protein